MTITLTILKVINKISLSYTKWLKQFGLTSYRNVQLGHWHLSSRYRSLGSSHFSLLFFFFLMGEGVENQGVCAGGGKVRPWLAGIFLGRFVCSRLPANLCGPG